MALAQRGPQPSPQEGGTVGESVGSAPKHLVQITKTKTSSNCSQPQQAAPRAATPRLLLVRSAFQVSDRGGMSNEHGMILLLRETGTQGGLMTPYSHPTSQQGRSHWEQVSWCCSSPGPGPPSSSWNRHHSPSPPSSPCLSFIVLELKLEEMDSVTQAFIDVLEA